MELRRQLKDRTAQLTLLTQRYDHLNARFEAVRNNHEKVVCNLTPHDQSVPQFLRVSFTRTADATCRAHFNA